MAIILMIIEGIVFNNEQITSPTQYVKITVLQVIMGFCKRTLLSHCKILTKLHTYNNM